ncbi:MAG: hypothetical protein ABIR47_13895 [Candidatus Kapaibacterium sp.]
MNKGTLTVFVIVGSALAVLIYLHFYVNEQGTQADLAGVECKSLLATSFELQGMPVLMDRDGTCALMRSMAMMQPTTDEFTDDPKDPWHYFGRLRIRPKNDVWFLVFVARRSENFKPLISLRRRNGPGWSVVGQFDAEPVLRQLGVYDRIDWARVKSDSSLVPTDQTTPM